MNCGEKIAQLRKKNNMTQAQLGDELSVTYQAVSKWERGESLPDFDTISRISKLFQVPISYFEEGGEEQIESEAQSVAASTVETSTVEAPTVETPNVSVDIIGMCVKCGKVVREGEAAVTEPQLICNACVELERQAEEQRKIDEQKEIEAQEQARQDRITYEQNKLKSRRNIALIIATIPAVAVFITFLVLALQRNRNMTNFLLGMGGVLAVCSFTFTSQMIWDGTVREVFTGGGKIISLPGIIFDFSPDGLIFLIVTKIILFFVAVIVFIVSIIFCMFAAFAISPFTFIVSLSKFRFS